LRDDDSVRVVIFTGAGDKAFVAGADIAEFAGRTALAQRAIMLDRGLFNAVDTFPKPVIAMVNGYCLGAAASWRSRATFGSPARPRRSVNPKSISASFPAAAGRSV